MYATLAKRGSGTQGSTSVESRPTENLVGACCLFPLFIATHESRLTMVHPQLMTKMKVTS